MKYRSALVALALTACGSGGATTSAGGTLGPDVGAAGRHYLAIVAPSNAAADKANSTDPVDYSAICRSLATTDEQFGRDLLAYQWPEAAQASVTDLANGVAEAAGDFYQCAKETNPAIQAEKAAAGVAASRRTSAAANAVRLALGLPLDH